MRRGITVQQQRKIVAFVREILRKQRIVAALVAGLVVVAWAVPRPSAPEPLGIVMVQQSQGSGGASGILVAPLLVLTSANLVGSQPEAIVSFPNGLGVTGQVLFADRKNDIALLALPSPASISPLPMSDSDVVTPGDQLVIAGYPGGSYSETPAKLIGNSNSILMTDVASHPGNSGGALLHADHSVVGLIGSTIEFGSARTSQTHWAIPINTVKKICRENNHPIE